jgi:hypothetical protein
MKYVEIIADAGSSGTVSAIAEKADAMDLRLGVVGPDGMQQIRMLISDDKLQFALDTLQSVLGAQPAPCILVLPVEARCPSLQRRRVKARLRDGCA